jgi:hypothetical protein
MGLDMWLMKQHYVKNWGHTPPESMHLVSVKQGGVDRKDIDTGKINYITEEVCTWRKANGIHAWFVNNCQDGNDDCKRYYVSIEKLKELHGIIVKILDNFKLAEELLPTQSGFFFGSYDYDEYYFDDLKFTRDVLDAEFKNYEEFKKYPDYYYDSSW